jgi:hypothetical protein
MIVHSCWCICFIRMSAQGLDSKVHLNSNRFGVSKGLEKRKGRKWKSKPRFQPAQPGRLLSSPWADFASHRPIPQLATSAAPHRPTPFFHRPIPCFSIGRSPPPHRPAPLYIGSARFHRPARVVPPPLPFWLSSPTHQRLPLLFFFPPPRAPAVQNLRRALAPGPHVEIPGQAFNWLPRIPCISSPIRSRPKP